MTSATKNVVALLASRRKGNTYRLLNDLSAQLTAQGITVTIYNLYDYDLEDCTGCQRCIFGKACGIRDDRNVLLDALRAADGVVLAAPVYMDHIPGRLKSFIDRTCAWFHRPELVGLPLLALATTGGSGLEQTLDYMEQVGTRWALFPTSRIGRTATNVNGPIMQSEYRAFVEHLHKPRHEYAPSLKQLMSFRVQHILAEVLFPIDGEYWKARGWLGQPYYYPCRIDPFKRAATATFHRYLKAKIQKARKKRTETTFTGGEAPSSGVVRLPILTDNDTVRSVGRKKQVF